MKSGGLQTRPFLELSKRKCMVVSKERVNFIATCFFQQLYCLLVPHVFLLRLPQATVEQVKTIFSHFQNFVNFTQSLARSDPVVIIGSDDSIPNEVR